MKSMLRALLLGAAILLPVRADPPALEIDSWPITANCKPAPPGSATGGLGGAGGAGGAQTPLDTT